MKTGLPFLSPRELPNQGIKPKSPVLHSLALQEDSLQTKPARAGNCKTVKINKKTLHFSQAGLASG